MDFAVLLDKKQEPPKYTILFKARDAEALEMVMQDYTARRTKNLSRPSVLQELSKMKALVASLPRKIKEKIQEHSRRAKRTLKVHYLEWQYQHAYFRNR